MSQANRTRDEALDRLRRPLFLTRTGMLAERLTRAFWPLWSVLFLALAALMLGLQDAVPLELAWGIAVVFVSAVLWACAHGVRQFHTPSRAEALDRLDRTLAGRPITALADTQAIGATDDASQAVWRAHLVRMADRVAGAKAARPDLRISARDPFALRYAALLALLVAVLFGSVWRVASVSEMAPGQGQLTASGPSWEGWIEPPAYTGKPSLYLNDINQEGFSVPEGSKLTLRLYGTPGALTVAETVSDRTGDVASASDPSQEFTITQDGSLEITGAAGAEWDITVTPDQTPRIALAGEAERSAGGEFKLPFAAGDDYGVVAAQATITLDMASVDRRFGLLADSDPRDDIVLDLPMPISGDRRDFTETIVENLAQHPWAGLPVLISLSAQDALDQNGTAPAQQIILEGRRFFDPLARAVVEQRRDILWSRSNGARAAQILRAVTHSPEGFIKNRAAYLQLRVAIRRLEAAVAGGLTPEPQDEVAQALWDIAILLEDGTLADALERLRQAQDRLAEAMRQGANQDEIAKLMQELRAATDDYIRQLAEQNQQDPDQQTAENQDSQEITGDQIQQMMDKIQELMEEGRMAEAQQLLDELNRMMENLQVTQGQQGQGQQSPGQQALNGLQDTLREQQGLSDEAFQDLQQQFNPEQGDQQGQDGQQGQEGQGAQQGEGAQGQGGQGTDQGQGQGPSQGPSQSQSLADRQQALRNELNRQQRGMPGAGTPEGDAARDALGRAGRAMDQAEGALRDNRMADALDSQSEAMEALREGMRNLGEAMAQQRQQQQGQQGEAVGRADPNGRRDPLGRDSGANGQVGSDENLLQGDDVYRRARDLLDEIRRRSSEQDRPAIELDYLKRLLDRF